MNMKKKISILIVDDNVNFTDTLSDLLSEKGFDCACTYSGLEGIAMAGKKAFDVILMDIKMPGLNGIDASMEIRKIKPKTAVILMTAYRKENLVKGALKRGIYGPLYKPFNIDRVVKTIEMAKKGV
jgi:DNA-binding NtrC family response regulator